MLFNYLNSICGFSIYSKILIFDFDRVITDDYVAKINESYGHIIIEYSDVESFRYLFESKIKKDDSNYLIIVRSDTYVPYDIRQFFYCKDIRFETIFPKLNPHVLKNSNIFDMDLLYISHKNLFQTLNTESETQEFLFESIYSLDNIKEYCEKLEKNIITIIETEDSYKGWQKIATVYSKLNFIKIKCCFSMDLNIESYIEIRFKEFILNKYNNLSSISAHNGPVLINRCLDYIFMNAKKPAIIVMDCMSIIDWLILSQGFEGFKYEYNSTYALIPTITSISRQSLLSGKLPIQLEKPFGLDHEKSQFIMKALENGFDENEVKYNRGFDFEIDDQDKCMCVIINDIDDLVHSQRQGNKGMYNDVNLLSHSKILEDLIVRLNSSGFDVYITSDHGHKETKTIGNPKGTGIEVESRSKRMLILKEFADFIDITNKFNMIDYPDYYLPKDYKYLICKESDSLGNKGNTIVSHGGISIEEVIVPFIKIKGVTNE